MEVINQKTKQFISRAVETNAWVTKINHLEKQIKINRKRKKIEDYSSS